MNNTIKVLSLLTFGIFILSACGKKYVCECTSNADPTMNKKLAVYTSLSKKDAKKSCDEAIKQPMAYYQDSIAADTSIHVDYSCGLH